MMQEPILKIHNLCKYFPITSKGLKARVVGWVKAVDQVSLEVMPGRTFGLIGESGCGKTTLSRTILRAIKPMSGQVWFKTRKGYVDLARLREKELKPLRTEMQMIFQDPFSSLNPRMTAGQIIGEPLRIHRLARGSELKDRVMDMLEKVGLKSEHYSRYPHAFSGGQRQRIGIARALIMRPRLVVADEPVSALDVSVQAQIINLLQDLQDEFHCSCIFVAHDLSVVKHICDEIAIMYAGKLVEKGPTKSIFRQPQHPYTRALLASIPYPDPDKKISFFLGGEVADPGNLPSGCSFCPRCANAFASCSRVAPELKETAEDRMVACHLY